MADFVLGKDAKIYQGAAGVALGSLTEMDNVRDVTLSLESGEADVTTRASGGWRATASTLKECSVEFEMVWKPSDSGFAAIKGAFLNATTLELAILDQARETSGAEGMKGAFSITSFTRGEPLEEALTVSVTAKLASFTEWVIV